MQSVQSDGRLDVVYLKVKEHLGNAIHRQKELYDTKVHGQELKVRGMVSLNNPVMMARQWQI